MTLKIFFEEIIKMLGLATLLAFVLVILRCIFDVIKKSLICEHHYKIQGYLYGLNSTILFLRCEKCNKEKQIEIFDMITIEKREADE